MTRTVHLTLNGKRYRVEIGNDSHLSKIEVLIRTPLNGWYEFWRQVWPTVKSGILSTPLSRAIRAKLAEEESNEAQP